jgi:hypothetical protein
MVIIGDFNIRLGDITGDAKTSPRTNLLSFANNLDSANLNLILPTTEPSWRFVSHIGRSIVDYAVVSSSIMHLTSALNVVTNGTIDSPHNYGSASDTG